MKKMSQSFSNQQRELQEQWRKKHISTKELGWQNKRQYNHIIPKDKWLETVWDGIKKELPDYLNSNNIHAHTGTHNLLSSWVLCANLYFPIKQSLSLRRLMVEFLKKNVFPTINNITEVELEFAFDGALHPSKLLGEQEGIRGSGQTSPDVAFRVKTENGNGIILTECKYTEHSFYRCSARRTYDVNERLGNPDPSRCMKEAEGCNYATICHQSSKTWGRKYWQHLELTSFAKKIFKHCPAATAGYQLFRQHALANGVVQSGEYGLVASCVAIDGRNTGLLDSLKSTGIADIRSEWGQLFKGNVIFKMWTHQEWVAFVRSNQRNNECKDWLEYVNERYGY